MDGLEKLTLMQDADVEAEQQEGAFHLKIFDARWRNSRCNGVGTHAVCGRERAGKKEGQRQSK